MFSKAKWLNRDWGPLIRIYDVFYKLMMKMALQAYGENLFMNLSEVSSLQAFDETDKSGFMIVCRVSTSDSKK